MEPWLDKRQTTSKKGALMLPQKTEATLSALTILIDYSYKTRRDEIFTQPTLSAIRYFKSIVSAIYGAKNAYRYYCGDRLDKETIAVSTYLNPDMILGLKDPLIRYATAFPAIVEANENFYDQKEYGLFLFCYRTLIFVLEELLLAVPNCDVRSSLSALYDLDAAFEDFKRHMIDIIEQKNKQGKKVKNKTSSNKELIASAERCANVLRQVSREFYIVEMLIMKTRNERSKKRLDRPTQMFENSEGPHADITKEDVLSFMHKAFGENCV